MRATSRRHSGWTPRPSIIAALMGAAMAALAPAAAGAGPTHEFGDTYGGDADEMPPEIEDVDIVEKLENEIPLGATFQDEDGEPVELADLFQLGTPVILTFNYSECPQLCGVQLGGLVDALRQMRLRPGEQFRIVTVSLDPTESPDIAAESKDHYLSRLEDGEEVAAGWHFLTGSEQSIEAVASAVGIEYDYDREKNEYFHAPALVFASPSGEVSSYQYGVRYEPEEVSEGITAAAMGDTRESARQFILSCFALESTDGHAATAFQIMRIGGIGFVVLAGGFAAMYAIRHYRKPRAEQLKS